MSYSISTPVKPTSQISVTPGSIIECSICLEPLNFQFVTLSKCPHKFHEFCIKKWAERTNICPLCKRRFSKIINSNDKNKIQNSKKPITRSHFGNAIRVSNRNLNISSDNEENDERTVSPLVGDEESSGYESHENPEEINIFDADSDEMNRLRNLQLNSQSDLTETEQNHSQNRISARMQTTNNIHADNDLSFIVRNLNVHSSRQNQKSNSTINSRDFSIYQPQLLNDEDALSRAIEESLMIRNSTDSDERLQFINNSGMEVSRCSNIKKNNFQFQNSIHLINQSSSSANQCNHFHNSIPSHRIYPQNPRIKPLRVSHNKNSNTSINQFTYNKIEQSTCRTANQHSTNSNQSTIDGLWDLRYDRNDILNDCTNIQQNKRSENNTFQSKVNLGQNFNQSLSKISERKNQSRKKNQENLFINLNLLRKQNHDQSDDEREMSLMQRILNRQKQKVKNFSKLKQLTNSVEEIQD